MTANTPKMSTSKGNFILNNIVYLLIIILAFGVLYGKIFDTKLDLNGDNYNYLMTSKNIVDGHGYSTLGLDGTYSPASWFPPGYPYILATAQFLGMDSPTSLKLLNGLFFLGTILLFYFVVLKITDNKAIAFSVALSVLFSTGLLRLSTKIMSEIPFLFFTLIAIFGTLKLDAQKKKPFWKTPYFYMVVLASIIAFYVRSFGILLIGALAFHWLTQKRWKLSLAYLGGIALLYLPYYIRNKMYGIKGRYMKTILVDNPWRPESGSVTTVSEFFGKIMTNFNDTILYGFPKVLFPSIDITNPSMALMILGILLLIILFWGVWNMKRYRYLFGSYLLLNMGIFLVWHTGNGVRYVWPLAGFIAFAVFYGIYVFFEKIVFPKWNKKMPFYLGFIFLLTTFFGFSGVSNLEKEANGRMVPNYKNYFAIAKELKRVDLGKVPVVACRKPAMFAYYSGALTTKYKFSLNDKEVIDHLIRINADFVVIDQLGYSSTGRYLVPAIQKNQALFPIFKQLKNPDTYLLRFDIEKAKAMMQQQ